MRGHLKRFAAAAAAVPCATPAFAVGAVEGGTKQAMNSEAIAMFAVFVLATLAITKWAASRTKSASDFYAAGGGITGF